MTFTDKLRQRAIKSQTPKALKKLTPYDILIKPLVDRSEKGRNLLTEWKYLFQVHQDATKSDVKAAIKYIYNVEPVSINTTKSPYKWRLNRKLVRREIRKAIVTLKKGDKIDIVK